MGDQEEEVYPGEGVDEGLEQEGESKGGFIPAFLVKILKYVALGLAAIIFIVTVVVITVNFLDRGPETGTYPEASPDYTAKTPVYQYYGGIEEIRARTSDETAYTVIVDAKLGYEKNNKKVQSELINREDQIIDLMRRFFSNYKAHELTPENEPQIKEKLKERSFMYAPQLTKKDRMELLQEEGSFFPPKNIKKEDMSSALWEVIERNQHVLGDKLEEKEVEYKVNIEEKIVDIQNKLMNKLRYSFNHLLREAGSKTEVIVSFLAVLELAKQRSINIDQEEAFADIIISK